MFLGKNLTNFFPQKCVYALNPTYCLDSSLFILQVTVSLGSSHLYGVRILTLSLHLKPTTPWPPFKDSTVVHGLIQSMLLSISRQVKSSVYLKRRAEMSNFFFAISTLILGRRRVFLLGFEYKSLILVCKRLNLSNRRIHVVSTKISSLCIQPGDTTPRVIYIHTRAF